MITNLFSVKSIGYWVNDMALEDFQPNQYTETVWNELVSFFGNEYGAAGMMANLYAESGCTPWRCQGWYGFSSSVVQGCANYYTQVDDGTISRADFTQYGWSDNQTIDTTGSRDGYGLAQWTTQGRKEGLYDTRNGRGIEDIQVQFEWLEYELNHGYTSTRDVCINATDVYEPADYVLLHFEVPANANLYIAQRRHYAEQIYDYYASGLPGHPIFVTAEGNGTAWASYHEVEIHRAGQGDRIELGAVPNGSDTFITWVINSPSTLTLEQPLTVANNYFIMPNETVSLLARFTGTTPTPPYPPPKPKYVTKKKHMPIWMYPMFR